jgi:thymidylate synthase (FAD)
VRIEVFPPHGFVRYIEHCGSEAAIVNAARVSMHKEIDEAGLLDADNVALLRFLLTKKHGSPFEQGFMSRWHCRLPIFVMREWVRHRVGFSVNEESGRYVELRPDMYIPEFIRSQQGKPGAYTFEAVDEGMRQYVIGEIKMATDRSFDVYRRLLDSGLAKEQARVVLPLNLYTEIRWTCNARSLMNFLALRNAPDAMYEIREYAKALEDIFASFMPNVHEIFVENGRVAP